MPRAFDPRLGDRSERVPNRSSGSCPNKGASEIRASSLEGLGLRETRAEKDAPPRGARRPSQPRRASWGRFRGEVLRWLEETCVQYMARGETRRKSGGKSAGGGSG